MQLELWREGEQAGAGDEKAEQGHLYTVPTREQGNIYKPNNKDMADEMNERQVYDAHTKEIDLVNRDPKHLNDHVVKLWARRRDARKRGRSQEGLAALEPPCCSTTVSKFLKASQCPPHDPTLSLPLENGYPTESAGRNLKLFFK
ncbi:PREDICTED: caveolin-1 isoform X7 [Myotis brandtii]|uniref:caveolin-1 isoform X7 n=1 Tax=Myotis brandtii TaxID=109478 RepID=UPI0007041989|nr:PREDICTED: caveolin-1 isoform X7 [Myotis brandtii]